LLSPEYIAERESAPTGRVVVLTENFPPTKAPEPMVVLPFFTVTVPVGAEPLDTLADTVVVNATDCPKADGLPEDWMFMAVP
jgi:hypothetical protein